MLIKPTTSLEKKALFLEAVLNETDKVSKISQNSVLSAFAYGIAKVAQKAEKDISIHMAYLYPDYAVGSILDEIASMYGQPPRFGQTGSSANVRLVAQPGTVYNKDVHFFRANKDNIQFNLSQTVTIPSWGYTYVNVYANTTGAKTNVDANAINDLTTKPSGHQFCINEVRAIGGRDSENDDQFRQRIKQNVNKVATSSLSMLEQRAIEANPLVLKLYNYGLTQDGKYRMAVATTNGVDLNQAQLNQITEYITPYLSIADNNVFGYNTSPIQLENVHYKLFDVSARVKLLTNSNVKEIVNSIQNKINTEYNFATWNFGSKIEWDNILQIVKNTDGVKYVYDDYFQPRIDIPVERFELPRLRGFLLLDEKGAIILDNTSNTQLMPLYYPNQADLTTQTLLLR